MNEDFIQPFHTAFNRGRIVQRGLRIDMEVEGATFATWHPNRLLTGYSWDAMSAAALLHHTGTPCRILLLGLAGGTMVRILRHLLPDTSIVAVEIDEELVALCTKYMHWEPDFCHTVISDAYQYLADTDQQFDVILDDVFLSGSADVYRPNTSGQRLVDLYRNAMKPNGLVAVNCITDKPHIPLLRDTHKELSSLFAQVKSITPPLGYNRALVAGDQLGTVRCVNSHKDTFPMKRDQAWWSKLRIR